MKMVGLEEEPKGERAKFEAFLRTLIRQIYISSN
jgi:hypothetical protein